MKTIIKCADGSIQIMTLVDGADEAVALKHWKLSNPDAYISHRQMPDSAIPTDRTYRHLWTDTTPELIIDIPADAVVLSDKKAARAERDAKLSLTDWIALSDTTISSEWATYRQALRDIPAQAGFPNSITWPTEPGE